MAATVAAQLAALTEIVKSLDVRAIEDRLERRGYHHDMAEALGAERSEAEKYRQEIKSELAELKGANSAFMARLDAIEPVVSMVSSARAKIVGGLLVLGFIGGAAIAVVTFFQQGVRDWIIRVLWS